MALAALWLQQSKENDGERGIAKHMKIRKILSGIRKQQCWRVQKQIRKSIKNCPRCAQEGWEPNPAISPFCSTALSDCGCDYNEIININPPNHSGVMKLLGWLWFLFMVILCIFYTTTCSSRGRKQTLQAQEAFCLSGVPEVSLIRIKVSIS